LVVNNLRDIDTDRVVGKKTLAVRLGARGAQVEYLLLVAFSYVVPPLMWLTGVSTPGTMLAWLSLPLVGPLAQSIMRQKGRPLNQALAGTARLELVYGFLFSVGIMIF
jgi:1,4-dihydroxy-2-naphthoate octaprenyltransferase